MAQTRVPNELALNLKVAEEDETARYDASARNLVSQKSILAYILKSSLSEYALYSVQEISEKYIKGRPQVSTLSVHQDHPDRELMSGLG